MDATEDDVLGLMEEFKGATERMDAILRRDPQAHIEMVLGTRKLPSELALLIGKIRSIREILERN